MSTVYDRRVYISYNFDQKLEMDKIANTKS